MLSVLLGLLRALPWRWIVPALGVAALLWWAASAGYNAIWQRGYTQGVALLQPEVDRLTLQIVRDRDARAEAAREDDRRAALWRERNADIEREAARVAAAVRADNLALRERLRQFAAAGGGLPADHSAAPGSAAAAGLCTLDAARRIVYAKIGEDLVRLAEDANTASAAAAECADRYDALVHRLGARE